MFRKKPQIKNLSPLRSSDRRKLADQIIASYHITVPTVQAPETTEPASETSTTTSLTTIRSSLLPDNTSSARFTTTSGPDATPVSGIVYVGTHAGQEERILWYTAGKDTRLIPTVYTLWQHPNLVPLVHTADFVVEDKLKTGADLMTPGLFKARSQAWDLRAVKGSIVAVASASKDTVPVWVGQCEVDIKDLPDDVRGAKGVAVKGLHWEGDELWSWSALGQGGMLPPASIPEWSGLSTRLDQGVQTMTLKDDEHDLDAQEDGGVALETESPQVPSITREKSTTTPDDTHESDAEDEHEPTTKEVDDAFFQAFLYSLYNAKKQNQSPHYGFDLPIQPSFLISNMIQPHLRIQNSHYNIKKSSWKNTKKFIKYLDKQLLVKSKDRNGGETVILDIDFNDQQLQAFQPYKLPKPKAKAATDLSNTTSASNQGDTSLGQTLSIHMLYRASSKLVPNLLPSKTTFYTAQQITSAIKSYIEANSELTEGVSISRNIKLDPFIANNILGSNSTSADHAALRKAEIDRGQLNRRVIDDDHLCTPYYVILRNEQTYDADQPTSSTMKPKPGTAPKIHITIERRNVSKAITRLSGLEAYFINPQVLAPEIQKKCAGSASVGQLTGGKPGMMEIVIQGHQESILVRDILANRGVKSQWVEVSDKTKKTKKGS